MLNPPLGITPMAEFTSDADASTVQNGCLTPSQEFGDGVVIRADNLDRY